MSKGFAATGLALWVGRKGKGTATLHWNQHELKLHIAGLQVIGVEGDDRERLAAGFGLVPDGEWFEAAQAAVAAAQVSPAEAHAVVKRALAEQLHEFFLASDGQVEFGGELPAPVEGLTISYPHLVVEIVLGAGGEDLLGVLLPQPNMILRRLPDFARRVGALGLTEEAMAVLAKINDQRTALEIAAPSPHGEQLALRLLAAAIGGGLSETTERITEVTLATPAGSEDDEPPAVRRRWWPWLVVVAAVVAAIVAWVAWSASQSGGGSARGGPWAIAIDGGCQPAETERLYRRQEQDSSRLRVVPFGTGDEKCKRLVWGSFATRIEAEKSISRLPSGVIARGFAPHVVLTATTTP